MTTLIIIGALIALIALPLTVVGLAMLTSMFLSLAETDE